MRGGARRGDALPVHGRTLFKLGDLGTQGLLGYAEHAGGYALFAAGLG